MSPRFQGLTKQPCSIPGCSRKIERRYGRICKGHQKRKDRYGSYTATRCRMCRVVYDDDDTVMLGDRPLRQFKCLSCSMKQQEELEARAARKNVVTCWYCSKTYMTVRVAFPKVCRFCKTRMIHSKPPETT